MELSFPIIVTFNIGGRGTIAQKKENIQTFLYERRHCLPAVLFLQENPWPGDSIKTHFQMIRDNYEAVSHKNKHVTILYRTDSIMQEGLMDLRIHCEFEDAFSYCNTQHLNVVTFRNRARFAKLTGTISDADETPISFIAISWHGEKTGVTDEEKKNKFDDLLKVVNRVRTTTNLPVILGGDFNIALNDVSAIIENQDLEVYDYEPANRDTVIDFFVATSDVVINDIKALDRYRYSGKRPLILRRDKSQAKSQSHQNATILYHTDVLKEDPINSQVQSVFNNPQVKKRASFATLTKISGENGVPFSFVAISWRAPQQGSSFEKKTKLNDLLMVAENVHSLTNLPVILGGDFNIPRTEVSGVIQMNHDTVFEVFNLATNNEDDITDFFVVTSDVGIDMRDLCRDRMYFGHVVFDHDPVKAMATVSFLAESLRFLFSEDEDVLLDLRDNLEHLAI